MCISPSVVPSCSLFYLFFLSFSLFLIFCPFSYFSVSLFLSLSLLLRFSNTHTPPSSFVFLQPPHRLSKQTLSSLFLILIDQSEKTRFPRYPIKYLPLNSTHETNLNFPISHFSFLSALLCFISHSPFQSHIPSLRLIIRIHIKIEIKIKIRDDDRTKETVCAI